MEWSDEMLKEISYIKISTYRTKAMKALEDDVKIPSVIAKDSGIRTNLFIILAGGHTEVS